MSVDRIPARNVSAAWGTAWPGARSASGRRPTGSGGVKKKIRENESNPLRLYPSGGGGGGGGAGRGHPPAGGGGAPPPAGPPPPPEGGGGGARHIVPGQGFCEADM